jgi:hypothetical protein
MTSDTSLNGKMQYLPFLRCIVFVLRLIVRPLPLVKHFLHAINQKSAEIAGNNPSAVLCLTSPSDFEAHVTAATLFTAG